MTFSDSKAGRTCLPELLAQVSLVASEGQTLDDVLKRIADCIVERQPISAAGIILLNDSRTHFVDMVYSGDMDLEPPGPGEWPITTGAAGRVVREGKPQLITDVDSDPDYIAGNAAVQSEYLIPIRHRDALLGVLNIESTHEDYFTLDVCAVFDAVARQVAGSIYLARVVAELEQANRLLEYKCRQDGLTGIANRRWFDQAIERAWVDPMLEDEPIALIMLDVDHFKAFNDERGHLSGDRCLREIGRLCAQSTRSDSDLAARYGGEEFVILLPGCDTATAEVVAERLRERVQLQEIVHPSSPTASQVTISLGVVALGPDTRSHCEPEELVRCADNALYMAKRDGRNRVVVLDTDKCCQSHGGDMRVA